jgi:hypothetical protein
MAARPVTNSLVYAMGSYGDMPIHPNEMKYPEKKHRKKKGPYLDNAKILNQVSVCTEKTIMVTKLHDDRLRKHP